jgi:RNA polymerase sigma factor (TIGR02999 family)
MNDSVDSLPAVREGLAPDSDPAPTSITRMLNAWSQGDDQALGALVPLVYDELRRMARRHMRHEREGHTLQGTGLVHEAFMRLAEGRSAQWASRGQFFGWMSTLMRRTLVDHARRRHAAKRGDGQVLQSLDALQDNVGELPDPGSGERLLDIVRLDEALTRLEALDPRQGRLVELRFFGGLSVDEAAEALQVSAATVKREWSTARAWLLRELGAGAGPADAG